MSAPNSSKPKKADAKDTTIVDQGQGVPTGDAIASGVEGGVIDQFKGYLSKLRGGDMGVLPAVAGFVVLAILFTFANQYFFTERNFANFLTQAAPIVMLSMAVIFVILLGEVDLSAGVTSGVAMAIFVVLSDPGGIHLNWILALILALLTGIAIGTFIGFFVARVGIPSFVVTLGLLLGLPGAQLLIIGAGGLYRIQEPSVIAIQNNNLAPWQGWAMIAVMLVISFVTAIVDRRRRSRAGVPNRTIVLLWLRLGVILVIGSVVVLWLNQNRGGAFLAISGVPIVVPITLAILWIGTFVLDRTRFGGYLYAIGGNPEAARRAGIKVTGIKWAAFVICSGLAVIAGLFSASKVGSVDASFGSTTVLPAIAAAVVGGVSLFGGRGRLIHGAVGALVLAVIANGLGLLNLSGGVNLLVTGGVLILAATVDAVSRVRAGGSLTRR